MSGVSRQPDEEHEGLLHGKTVSRREFLRIAGIAGATVGLGAGLGGVLTACGNSGTTSSTTEGSTTSNTTEGSTTVSSGAEQGREIKIGNPCPVTGALAAFGAYESWANDVTNKTLADGIVLGDGKKHKITVIERDAQSDTNRASQVAGDMVTNEKVDMLISSGTPDMVNSTAAQAEALGCPMVSTNNVIGAFAFVMNMQPDTVLNWVYGLYFGIDQELVTQPMAYDKVPTNKKIGILLANEVDGNSWAAVMPDGFTKLGYQVTFPQQYQPGAEDFTVQIAAFKKAGCEILTGTHYSSDFTNFWLQAQQQGYRPKLVFIGGKAFADFAFPKALGPSSVGLMANWLFHKSFPFTDPLTGKTGAELCDQYEADTGNQWSENVGVLSSRAWAIDALKRATNPEDKQSIVDAIKTTKMEVLYGPIDFTEPVDPNGRRPYANVYKQVSTTAQCVNGADAKPTPNTKFPYETNVVGKQFLPDVPDYQTIEQQYS